MPKEETQRNKKPLTLQALKIPTYPNRISQRHILGHLLFNFILIHWAKAYCAITKSPTEFRDHRWPQYFGQPKDG
jgi:hypothetical protein